MKITEINISEGLAKNKGLKPIKMTKLGNVVLIAGQNGSGKTRLLQTIIDQANYIPKKSVINQFRNLLSLNEANLSRAIVTANKFEQQIQSITPDNQEKLNDLISNRDQTLQNIQSFKDGIVNSKRILEWDILKVDDYQENYTVVEYVPKDLRLIDSASRNPLEIEKASSESANLGVKHLSSSTLAKIQLVCTRYTNATHPRLKHQFTKNEIESAIADFDQLQEYFKIYLGTTIKINLNGLAEIFNLPIGQAKLSDGQIILIQYCLALFSQEAKIDGHLLILDEPENHLHPEILLNTLDKIVEANQNGQVWIATHSINVLAHFFEKDIWFMEEGEASFMGRTPERVLKSLLGDDDEIEKLSQFISLPSIFATNHYAFEALKYPLALMTGKTDPQSQQIFSLIKELSEGGQKLKLLDMGAGKGRFLKSIKEINDDTNLELSQWLDYYAFDKFPDDKEICENVISNVYGSHDSRYFNTENTMISTLDLSSFDVIIMVNVLHEIPPMEWSDLFNKSSSVQSLLKPEGKLIIVEDQVIPTGEKAYTEGFLVFDVPEFKKLFNLSTYPFVEKYEGRLKAHIFDKQDLRNFSPTNLKDALESIFFRSKKEVENIRNSTISYKNGMVHGFWVQQLANAYLVMNKMGFKD